MSKQLKRRMFQVGSEALAKVRPVDPGLYACPICLRAFDSSALEEGHLTLEHVPSKAIGGKPLVLTCRDCNSELGHTVDAAADDRQTFLSFVQALSGESHYTGRVKLTLNDEETVNAQLEVNGSEFKFQIVDQINNPKKQAQLNESMHSMVQSGGWDGSTTNVSPVRGLNWKLAQRADLKNAYLIAFASLGYSYILRECLQVVREQLVRPREDVLGLFSANHSKEPRFAQKLLFVESPFEAMAVQFGIVFVFLPPPHDVGDFYSDLRDNLDSVKGSGGDMAGVELQWPTGLELRMDRLGRGK